MTTESRINYDTLTKLDEIIRIGRREADRGSQLLRVIPAETERERK